jgi:mono/diheme cytochrome c family protein
VVCHGCGHLLWNRRVPLSGSLNAQSVATPSFTDAQATQGKAVYDRNCLSCHGANLDDGEFGPPLKGVEFRLAGARSRSMACSAR